MEFTQDALFGDGAPVRGSLRRLADKRCQHCGKNFRPGWVGTRFCSRACVGAARRLPAEFRGENATELPCTRCGKTKPVADFYPHAATARGYQYWCKLCHTERGRRIPPSPETVRRRKLREMYGITMAEYDALYAQQDGRCAICRVQKEPWEPGAGVVGRQRFLTVDHDHGDGHIRGLLCGNCNAGLGQFRDDTAAMLAAVAYIKRDGISLTASLRPSAG